MNRAACLAVGLLVFGWMVHGAAAQDFSGQQPEPPSPGAGSSIPSLPAGGTRAAGGLPVAIKNAADASGYQDQINTFIQQQVGKIAGNVPADQRAAREMLVAECTSDATRSFQSIYAGGVNAAVVALLDKTPAPPLRVRLNLAVMVESIAHTTHDAALRPAVTRLVNDPAEPVALWGIRAARSLLVPAAQSNATTADPLVADVTRSVKAHVKFGYLADEAYRTLSLEGEGVALGNVPNSLTISVLAMLDLVEFRVSLYQKTVPDDPQAEGVAARFFSASYKSMAPAEQQHVVQALVNLVTVIGGQAAGLSGPANGPAHALLEQMVSCLKTAGQSLTVITQEPPGTPLERVGHLVAGNSGAPIFAETSKVFAELQSQTRYAFLKQPPAVTPATRPTTQRRTSTPAPIRPAPAAAAAAG